jgi:fatty-acyl-CoA synthase
MASVTAAHARGPSQPALLDETIGANLERMAARFAERAALVSCEQTRRFTYAEFDAAVDDLARGLLARGLEAGDRLGIWSPNRWEWTLVQYASAKLGVILVNINPAYGSSEVAYALAQSGCRALVAAQGFRDSDYTATLAEVRARLPALEWTVWLDGGDWDDLLADGRSEPLTALRERSSRLHPDDAINIQYTSGTTGFPKGAVLTHRNILNNGYLVGHGCHYSEHDRICIPVPFYHCFGMVMGNLGATTHGACMVIPSAGFDAGATLAAVSGERCTSLYGVPTMFIAELAHPSFAEHDLSSLRTGIMAGSPCPVEIMRRVVHEMSMAEVTICYGMTETSPVSTQSSPDDPLELRVSTVGRVHPHLEIKLVDPATGKPVARGETGELCTRGYSVMRGYWNDEERTREAIDDDGFMHTGDLATMDEQGYVNIVGRSKDMIIRGGENVYPREVEEYLHGHPDVVDVQVIGIPDERLGEEIMAWVVLRPGAATTADDLAAYCTGRIARFKTPRQWKLVDEFPMTITGKVQKYRMREIAVAELGLERAASTRMA